MKIVIPDDYQDAIRHLDCFSKLDGHDVTIYNDWNHDLDLLAERFKPADALVLIRERTPITAALLDRLPKLRLISQTGRVMPHIDLAACKAKGITITASGAATNATAELTWALILASTRHLVREAAAIRAGKWQTTIGTELYGRTLGILGYGKIGSVVAKYGRAFGMNVLVHGREGSLTRAAADGYETVETQRALFQQVDVLSIHVKLNADTRGMVTVDDLMAMKPTAHFVNTSRAELVTHGALVEALKAGRPGYAAVDVYESEPVVDHPLLHMENVLCTPHIGYVEKDSYERFFSEAFDSVLAFAVGNPINVVD